MKTLDWSVETLGLDYNSTGLCIIIYLNQSSERNMNDIYLVAMNEQTLSLIMPSSLLQVVNSLLQLGTSSANKTCQQLVNRFVCK